MAELLNSTATIRSYTKGLPGHRHSGQLGLGLKAALTGGTIPAGTAALPGSSSHQGLACPLCFVGRTGDCLLQLAQAAHQAANRHLQGKRHLQDRPMEMALSCQNQESPCGNGCSPVALTLTIPAHQRGSARETTPQAPRFSACSGSVKSFSHFLQKQKKKKKAKQVSANRRKLSPSQGLGDKPQRLLHTCVASSFLSSHPKSIQVILNLESLFSIPGYRPR